MDDVELQFMKDVTQNVTQLKGKMTDGQSSKYTGFGNQREVEIARQILRESEGRGDVAGAASPVYQPDNMDGNLQPLHITPEMIKEIQELEGDVLLPEYANRKNIVGNPSQHNLQPNTNQPNPYQSSDPNQLEMNFDKITVDHVYEQYGEVMKSIDLMKKEFKKELQIIKNLLESVINE